MKKVLVIMIFFTVAALWGIGEAQMTKPAKPQVPSIDMQQTDSYKTATFAMG